MLLGLNTLSHYLVLHTQPFSLPGSPGYWVDLHSWLVFVIFISNEKKAKLI